jgi:hypothetical protein
LETIGEKLDTVKCDNAGGAGQAAIKSRFREATLTTTHASRACRDRWAGLSRDVAEPLPFFIRAREADGAQQAPHALIHHDPEDAALDHNNDPGLRCRLRDMPLAAFVAVKPATRQNLFLENILRQNGVFIPIIPATRHNALEE